MKKITNWQVINYTIAILVIIYFIFSIIGQQNPNNSVTGENGVIQFESNQFTNKQTLNIKGPWQFYPRQFIVSEPETKSKYIYANIPSSWSFLKVDNDRFSPMNYASYRINLELPPSQDSYSIKFLSVRSANKVYLNGELQHQSGQIGKSKTESKPYNTPFIVTIPKELKSVELVVEVSNYHTFNSGIVGGVMIGHTADIYHTDAKYKMYDALTIAGFLLLALLFLPQLFIRKNRFHYKTHIIYFILLSLSCAIGSATFSEKLMLFMFPDFPFLLYAKIQAAFYYTFIYLFFLYATEVLEIPYKRTAAKWAHLIFVVEMVVIAISPLNYHGIFAFYIVPVATISVLYIFYLTIRMKVYKRLKDGLWELGMVGIVLFIANAYISQIMTQGFYVSPPIYLLVFILAQVFMWNRQINQLYLEKVDLTESLERTNQSLRNTLNSLKKSELTLLRAQIKPHFLFNAINSIIAVSMKDAKQARELLFKLGEYLHYQFDFDKDVATVPFSKELESIEAYLTLEKARFKDRLNVIIDAREINFSVPPLLIQPLVENAIRHGLMVRQHGGTLTLRVIVEEQTVQISVEDDGVGISEEIIQKIMNPQADEFAFIKTGVGLANINQRLLKEYGTTLHIALRQGGGTIVSLRIPNRKV